MFKIVKMRNCMKLISIKYVSVYIVALCISTSSLASGLNGSYTIDRSKAASTSNYTSMRDADSDLVYGIRANGTGANGPGVNGAVTFNFADGVYPDTYFLLSNIKGTSSSNTITFQSASKDSSKVILAYDNNGGTFLALRNAHYIHFNQLTIGYMPTKNLNVNLQFDSGCSFIKVTNCRLLGNGGYTTIISSRYYYNLLNDDSNVFRNNYITNAGVAIDWNGYNTNTSFESGNIFDHNVIDSVSLGINVNFQNSVVITDNKINIPNTGSGINGSYIRPLNYTNADTGIIANNFISVYANTPYNYTYYSNNSGINLNDVDNIDIVYNNINIYGKSRTGSCALLLNPNYKAKYINVINNNLYNSNNSNADVAFIDTNASIKITEDYNNLYAGNGYPVGSGSAYSGYKLYSISTWRALGFAAHDTSADPLYNSNTDLHANAFEVNNDALPFKKIRYDIDGVLRDSLTPDIGANEFSPQAVFPAIIAITKPTTGFCPGITDIYATIISHGIDTLKSASISWTVNDTAMTPFLWTGALTKGKSINIKIASYNFSDTLLYTVKAYPSLANGITFNSDSLNTASASFYTGIKGTFLIDNSGTGSPDYSNITNAVNILNRHGVCGAVIYNIADGTYPEQINIHNVPNTSTSNTITFQSKSLDSSKVIIDPVTSPSLFISNTNFINIRSLNLAGKYKNAGSVVIIQDSCRHVLMERCSVHTAPSYYDPFGYTSAITCISSSANYFTMKNNYLSGAAIGIDIYGKGNIIEKNTVHNFSFMGMRYFSFDSFTIVSNSFFSSTSPLGVYLNGQGNTYTDTNLFANNFISVRGLNTIYSNLGCGMLVYYSDNLKIYNNSIASNSVGTGDCTFYALNNNNAKYFSVKNNIFYHRNKGVVIFTRYAVTESDYNTFFTAGNQFGSPGIYGNYSNLTQWQAKTGWDAHSDSALPYFVSDTGADMHLTSSSIGMIGKGTPIALVSTDIDGDLRNPNHPDIGADEYSKYTFIEQAEKKNSGDITIAPNPFNNRINIEFSTEKNSNIQTILYGIDGKIVYSQNSREINAGMQQIQIETGQNIKPGIYLLKIIIGDGVYVKRIVKAE